MVRQRPRLQRIALACVVLLSGAAAAAAERRPVPALTIYPGDIIRDEMLTDASFPDAVATGALASNRTMLVGKVAKRTLLPGQPIPTNSIGQPRLVTVGQMVRLVYEDGGLVISTYASALQAGAAGDLVAVRNAASGIVVSGIIHADGSIHVGSS